MNNKLILAAIALSASFAINAENQYFSGGASSQAQVDAVGTVTSRCTLIDFGTDASDLGLSF